MAAQQTPREFAREVFEYDVQVLRHLVFWKEEDIDDSTLPPSAHQIASDLVNGNVFHSSVPTTVLELYMLDESKKTALQLLEGEY